MSKPKFSLKETMLNIQSLVKNWPFFRSLFALEFSKVLHDPFLSSKYIAKKKRGKCLTDRRMQSLHSLGILEKRYSEKLLRELIGIYLETVKYGCQARIRPKCGFFPTKLQSIFSTRRFCPPKMFEQTTIRRK